MTTRKNYPELRRKVGASVWLRNSHYTQYLVREWTSLFVTIFCLVYIYELYLAWSSPATYLDVVSNPAIVFFNVIVLIFVLYHAVTWFDLTGKIQPIKIGRTVTKPWQSVVVNLILLIIISYIVIVLFGVK